ncbi:MAG: filamentous hemagglutinin N-terminal domain-containing protein, partial [Pseudomonadota bacterium]
MKKSLKLSIPVVQSESTSSAQMRRHALAIAVSAAFALPQFAYALPTGGVVVSGNSAISQPNPSTLSINQTTGRSAVNWTGFNTSSGESVLVSQPAGGVALYRVASPVEFFGRLSANGQIFLSSPMGVLFGAGSSIDVGGLAATTLSMSDANFNSGNYVFTNNGVTGSVTNRGTIVSPNGFVALMGPQVSNEGIISARMGSVALAAGDKITLDMVGDGLIKVTVDQAALNAAAMNKGTIEADGGNVLMTARSANALLDTVVNNQGVIRATSLVDHGGVVKLVATGDNSAVANYGTIDVSAAKANAASGSVLVSGPYVGNAGTILAKGADGATGGHVELTSTKQTILASGSTIDVSGVGNSNAGSVRIWSDENSVFAGGATILAKGGDTGGDGGFVEFSSGGSFTLNGRVDASAPKGKTGTFLLDPTDLYIVNTAGDQDGNFVVVPTVSATLPFAAGDTTNNEVSVGQLQALGEVNILLQATNSLTVGTSLGASANVDLSATLLTSTNTLTLQAGDATTLGGGNVTFNTGSSITTGGGGVVIIAGDPVVQKTGTATLGAIDTSAGGGAITVTAQQGMTLNGLLKSDTGLITLSANQGGAGATGFTMAAGSSITTNATVGAVAISVNNLTGTGGAALTDITTGAGGQISVNTASGGTTGGSITNAGQTTGLDVGAAGTITLTTPLINASGIGSSGTHLKTKTAGGSLVLAYGTNGAFIDNTGDVSFSTTNTTAPIAITSTGTLTLPATSFSTGAGSIDFESNGGTLTTAGDLSTTSGSITLVGSGGVSIGHNLTTTLAGGTLSLSSTGNAITQTAGTISIKDTTTLTADTTAGATADLTMAGNDFNTVSLASTGGGTFG